MGRKKSNNAYCYYSVSKESKQSTCLLCSKVLKTIHGANLLKHLRCVHRREFEEVNALNKGHVVYEYVVDPVSPASSNGNLSSSRDIKPNVNRASSEGSRSSMDSSQQRLSPERDKYKQKSLIQKLTEQKLSIASLQRELIEKQIKKEELQIVQIQEDTEHRSIMRELEKQEIMLRIKSLKANFSKNKDRADNRFHD